MKKLFQLNYQNVLISIVLCVLIFHQNELELDGYSVILATGIFFALIVLSNIIDHILKHLIRKFTNWKEMGEDL